MTDSSRDELEKGVRIERVIQASIEEVFNAWTEPTVMAKWFSPSGQAEVEADVRVNGQFRLVMVGEGRRIDHEGEYAAVEPPRLLSFTWRSPYTAGMSSKVTISLEPDVGGTRLLLLHEQLPDEAVESHEDGWGSILDRLESTLAPQSR